MPPIFWAREAKKVVAEKRRAAQAEAAARQALIEQQLQLEQQRQRLLEQQQQDSAALAIQSAFRRHEAIAEANRCVLLPVSTSRHICIIQTRQRDVISGFAGVV